MRGIPGRRRCLQAVIAMVGVFALLQSLSAHHAMSPYFDISRRFVQPGTLTELDWRYPHVHILVRLEGDAEHEAAIWSLEGPAPGFFLDRDVSKELFEAAIGTTVQVDASPSRDGSATALLRQITLADGTVVSACPQNC